MKTQFLKLNHLLRGLYCIALLFSTNLYAQEVDLSGTWKGAIEIPNMNLEIMLDFQKEGDNWTGDLDIPLQGVKDMNLAELKVEGDAISFKLPEVGGNANFSGKVSENTISGDYSQNGATFPLNVKREDAASMAAEKLSTEEAVAKIRELAEIGLEKSKVPGVAVGIIKDGKVLLSEGFGYKDLKNKKKVTEHTQFAIGSASKTFTSAGLALLHDKGKLDWDKPIRNYMPEFEMKDKFASEEMTGVDLLCHRSGLPRHDLVWYGADLSRNELMGRLKYLQPNASFRTTWQYQNLMFMTAGILVERLSNQSWEDFTQKEIFDVLGMDNSNFSVEKMQTVADYALPYQLKDEAVSQMPYRNIDAIGPAGSINSSITDMLKWVQLQLAQGKYGDKQVISTANVKKMHQRHMIISPGNLPAYIQMNQAAYGLGWFLYEYKGKYVVEHGGNIDGFSALVYLVPEEDLGMVLLTNMNGNQLPGTLSKYATDLLLGLEETDYYGMIYKEKEEEDEEEEEKDDKPKENQITGTKPSHDLKAYTGEYMDPGYGTIQISLDKGTLRAKYNAIDMKLAHWHYDVFQGKVEAINQDIPLLFQMDAMGQIRSVSMTAEPKADAIVFTKQAPNQLKDLSFLKKLTGDYYMDKFLVEVRLKGNILTVLPQGQDMLELVGYKDTSFKIKNLDGYVLDFVMDNDRAEKVIFNQPNGVFEASRKED